MDAKITKKRLSHMLSYDWLKIIGACVVAIIVWTLVFTTSATRITPAQQFSVFSYKGNILGTKFSESFQATLKNGVFSHEVLELTTNDLETANEYMHTVLEARLATNEGDVIFVADAIDEETATEVDGETKYLTYLESFVGSWYYKLMRLDGEEGFFSQMTSYLDAYYYGDYEAGELNKALVESSFRARIKENKDKRYKTEEQINAGIQGEYERFDKYRTALINFNSYVEKGYVTFTDVTLQDATGASVTRTYGINLCPTESMENLKELVAYVEKVEDENGVVKSSLTAKNMNVCLFNLDMEEGFEYESLLYVNYIIESYCTEL
jgi:hypothetical protein